MRHYKTLILPLILLSLPLAASAEVPQLSPLNFKARYDASAGPAGIGRLRISVRESPMGGYQLTVDTKTKGLVRLFSREVSVASIKGSIHEGHYLPILYTSFADKQNNDQDRHVKLEFDEEGHLKAQERTPMDGPKWRPPVTIAEAADAVDPITGFFELRQKLRDAMAREQREVSVKTYDGARLATMNLKVISRASIELGDKHVPAINTVITRSPIKGYTPKEMKKYKEGDPVVHIYFSADDRFMPLKATITLGFGDIVLELADLDKTR